MSTAQADRGQGQASYVDQAVLTPLIVWVSLKLFGVSLLGLRMWPSNWGRHQRK